jgi:hypothetical protein
MAERFDSGFYDAIYVRIKEREMVRKKVLERTDDIHRRFSTDLEHYGLGQSGCSLDLCPSASKGDDVGSKNKSSI